MTSAEHLEYLEQLREAPEMWAWMNTLGDMDKIVGKLEEVNTPESMGRQLRELQEENDSLRGLLVRFVWLWDGPLFNSRAPREVCLRIDDHVKRCIEFLTK